MIQLTRRERRLGIGMIVVGAVWSLYGFALQPMRDRIDTLQRIIPDKRSELREVRALSDSYATLRREIEAAQARMAAQDSDFQLLRFLESLIDQHQLTPYVATMKGDTLPSQPGYAETVVEIGLEGITLSQLVHFLEAVETSQVLAQVGTLHIRKTTGGSARLYSTIQISSPRVSHNTVAAELAPL
ncbi:MAG: type II secretion system protein M [Phycisphaerales bacterium]|nr:MAG: type II secretion system protein M [Phycisphaerales bacterium]